MSAAVCFAWANKLCFLSTEVDPELEADPVLEDVAAEPLTTFCDVVSQAESKIIAKIADKLAGYILYFEYKKTIRIYSIAISQNYQGQGVARALIEHLLATSTKDISLEVNTSNDRAIALYNKFDFVITKTITRYYEDGASAFKMLLRRD